MANFPSAPTTGQVFTSSDLTNWVWDGSAWKVTNYGLIKLPVSQNSSPNIQANSINFVNTSTVTANVDQSSGNIANVAFNVILGDLLHAEEDEIIFSGPVTTTGSPNLTYNLASNTMRVGNDLFVANVSTKNVSINGNLTLTNSRVSVSNVLNVGSLFSVNSANGNINISTGNVHISGNLYVGSLFSANSANANVNVTGNIYSSNLYVGSLLAVNSANANVAITGNLIITKTFQAADLTASGNLYVGSMLDANSANGNVSITGNLSVTRTLNVGSLLTANTGNGNINIATSNVYIAGGNLYHGSLINSNTANANVAITGNLSVTRTLNVGSLFTANAANGNINVATGNVAITTGNLYLGTLIDANTGNANVAISGNLSVTRTLNVGSLLTANASNGNINIATSNVYISGNLYHGTLINSNTANGNVAITGNLSVTRTLNVGSLFTANTGNGNIDIGTANIAISAGNLEFGTLIDANTGNANVAITGNLSVTRTLNVGSLFTANAANGNINVATGNVAITTGNLYLGTLIDANTGNANVAITGNLSVTRTLNVGSLFTANASNGNIDITTANITVAVGNLEFGTLIDANTGNANVAITGNLSVTRTLNVGSLFTANASNGNINVATGNLAITTGNLYLGTLINGNTGNGNVAISGNLSVTRTLNVGSLFTANTGNGNIDIGTANISVAVGNLEFGTLIDANTGNANVAITGNLSVTRTLNVGSLFTANASNGNINVATGNLAITTGNLYLGALINANTGNANVAITGNLSVTRTLNVGSVFNANTANGNVITTGNLYAGNIISRYTSSGASYYTNQHIPFTTADYIHRYILLAKVPTFGAVSGYRASIIGKITAIRSNILGISISQEILLTIGYGDAVEWNSSSVNRQFELVTYNYDGVDYLALYFYNAAGHAFATFDGSVSNALWMDSNFLRVVELDNTTYPSGNHTAASYTAKNTKFNQSVEAMVDLTVSKNLVSFNVTASRILNVGSLFTANTSNGNINIATGNLHIAGGNLHHGTLINSNTANANVAITGNLSVTRTLNVGSLLTVNTGNGNIDITTANITVAVGNLYLGTLINANTGNANVNVTGNIHVTGNIYATKNVFIAGVDVSPTLNAAANTVAVYANDSVIMTKANVNFENTSSINVLVAANATTGRANVKLSVNASTQLQRTAIASQTVAGAGWYRVASSNNATNGRGGFEVFLHTSGGSFTPHSLHVQGFMSWGTYGHITSVQSSNTQYWNSTRLTYDSGTTTAYLEVYFTQAVSSLMQAWTRQYSLEEGGIPRWAPISGALTAGGGTVLDEYSSRVGLNTGQLTVGNNVLYVDRAGLEVAINSDAPTSNLHVFGNANITSNVHTANLYSRSHIGINTAIGTVSSNLHITGNANITSNLYTPNLFSTNVGTSNVVTTNAHATSLTFTGIQGDKISLYDNRLGLDTGYAFGVETSTLYAKTFGGGAYRWYIGVNADGGTSDTMELNPTNLDVNSTGGVRAKKFTDIDDTTYYIDLTSATDSGLFSGNVITGRSSGNRFLKNGPPAGGYSAFIGQTSSTDAAALSYRAYLSYDAYWNGTNWVADRTNLGRKWLVDMGYHTGQFRVRYFDGTVSSPWTDADWTNYFVVDRVAGNVGIGVSAPTSKLHVSGNSKITSDLIVSDVAVLPAINAAANTVRVYANSGSIQNDGHINFINTATVQVSVAAGAGSDAGNANVSFSIIPTAAVGPAYDTANSAANTVRVSANGGSTLSKQQLNFSNSYTTQVTVAAGATTQAGNANIEFNSNSTYDIALHDTYATRITSPEGGTFARASASTGALQITLPVWYQFTMMSLLVHVYDYGSSGESGKSFTMRLGGYNYDNSVAGAGRWSWVNCFAYQESMKGIGPKTVRFGDDGTYTTITIGETTDTYNFGPQVYIENLDLGYSGASSASWKSPLTVSQVTSLPANTKTTKYPSSGAGEIYANSGSRQNTTGLNFVNTSTVQVSVAAGAGNDAGNANISFSVIADGAVGPAYSAANAAANTVRVYANGGSQQDKSFINFSNTTTINVAVAAGAGTFASNANIAFNLNVNPSLDVYSGAVTGAINIGRSVTERAQIEVTDTVGYFRYIQDETDTNDHSFNFEITSTSTGPNRFNFNKTINVSSTGAGVNTGLVANLGDITAGRTDHTGAIYLGRSGNNYLYFDGTKYQFGTTANIAPVYIPSGNLGLNIAVPTSNLHLVGNANITNNVYTANLYSRSHIGINTAVPSSNLHITGNANITSNVYTGNVFVTQNIAINIAVPTSNLHIFGNANITSNVYTANLYSRSHIGINTAVPSSNLHITGNANVTTNVYTGNVFVSQNLAINTTSQIANVYFKDATIMDTPVVSITAANFSANENCAGKILVCDNTTTANPVNVTFTAAAAAGFAVTLLRKGTGNTIILAGAGVTKQNSSFFSTANIANRYCTATVIYTATNEIILVGDIL